MPDERFDFLVDHWKPASVVPAYLNVVDIAGLVKGAHEGEVMCTTPPLYHTTNSASPLFFLSLKGLGNAFLSNISACDAICHVTRAFEDGEIIHVEGDVDPVRDLDIIGNELRLKDLAVVSLYVAWAISTVTSCPSPID